MSMTVLTIPTNDVVSSPTMARKIFIPMTNLTDSVIRCDLTAINKVRCCLKVNIGDCSRIRVALIGTIYSPDLCRSKTACQIGRVKLEANHFEIGSSTSIVLIVMWIMTLSTADVAPVIIPTIKIMRHNLRSSRNWGVDSIMAIRTNNLNQQHMIALVRLVQQVVSRSTMQIVTIVAGCMAVAQSKRIDSSEKNCRENKVESYKYSRGFNVHHFRPPFQ